MLIKRTFANVHVLAEKEVGSCFSKVFDCSKVRLKKKVKHKTARWSDIEEDQKNATDKQDISKDKELPAGKNRKGGFRKRFTDHQRTELETLFQENNFLSRSEKLEVSSSLGLSKRQV